MTVLEWIALRDWRTEFFFATLACLIVFFVFHKKAEFSRHALENSAVTILIAGANVGAAFLFVDEINAGAQRLYDALYIPHLDGALWENVPLWIVCLLAIAAKDFVDYWNHRLMHTKWGWPTHAAHHSDTHVNAFTTYRVHFLEQIMMTAGYILVLTWLQMPQAIPVVVVFSSLHNMYVHMDLPYDHGRLKYLIASPVFHRWHHADTPEAYGKNLANVMPVYDWLFGTYYAAGPCTAPMGALKSGIKDKDPIAIYLYPFQEWHRLISAAMLSNKARIGKAQLWIAKHLRPAR